MSKKELYDYKLGEEYPEDMLNGLIEAPSKLVKIAYTFQDKKGTQIETALVHKDFIEDVVGGKEEAKE